jgi:hypothetical protein
MIPGNPPASNETSLEKLARAIRSLFEGGVGGPSPAAATDNAVARWDGTDGRTVQNSTVLIGDTGVMTRTGQPAFSAHKNGTDQTGILTTTLTKITFTTELFDANSDYDAANSKWTPPAGKVLIIGAVFWSANIGNGNFITSVFKNGTRFKDVVQTNAGAATWGGFVSIIDNANGSDFYEIFASGPTTASNGTIDGTTATYFMGYMF